MENMIADTEEQTRQKEKQKQQLNADTIKLREEIAGQKVVVESKKEEFLRAKELNKEIVEKIHAKENTIQLSKEQLREKEQE